MSDSESALRELFLHLVRSGTADDFAGRDIIVTPFNGNYGQVAGTAIVLDGSPPRGIIVHIQRSEDGYSPQGIGIGDAFYLRWGSSKRLGERQYDVVVQFLKEHTASMAL